MLRHGPADFSGSVLGVFRRESRTPRGWPWVKTDIGPLRRRLMAPFRSGYIAGGCSRDDLSAW